MRRTKEQLILDLNTALDFYKDNNITVKNCSIKFNKFIEYEKQK